MATLSKRCSLNQKKLLRAIEGAVKNASDAHPEKAISPTMARSVSKRAVGTISAIWPELLVAASELPSGGVPEGLCRVSQHPGHTKPCPECSRRAQYVKHSAKRGVTKGFMAPLKPLIDELATPLRELKRDDPARAEIHIDLLKKIDQIIKRM